MAISLNCNIKYLNYLYENIEGQIFQHGLNLLSGFVPVIFADANLCLQYL